MSQVQTSPALHKEEFTLLRDFISEHFGIWFSDDKQWLLESKLKSTMTRGGYSSFFAYYQHLMQLFFMTQSFEHPEFTELLGLITNHETFFDRESGAYDYLVSDVVPRLDSTGNRPLRILHAACATGEEPYSLVIRYLEKTNEQRRPLEVIAFDIEEQSVNLAKKGVYGESAFRTLEGNLWNTRYKQYFTHSGTNGVTRYTINNDVRSFVSFRQVNVIDTKAMMAMGKFDIIFCRNMLIYFSNESKNRVLETFHRMLREPGYLFLGHAESASEDSGFQMVSSASCLVYEKR